MSGPAPGPEPAGGQIINPDTGYGYDSEYNAQLNHYQAIQAQLTEYDKKEVQAQLELDKLKAEMLQKEQTLGEKKKIALDYLAKEAAKNAAKKPGNPLLVVNPYESGQLYGGGLKKATSVKGSSHDKSGAFGGVSSYTDSDVDQARSYMQSVLCIDSMSVNGRALEHILAEVYGFAKRDCEQEINKVKSQLGKQKNLETQVEAYSKSIKALEARVRELDKAAEVAKKLDKETVAKTSTGRRIKE